MRETFSFSASQRSLISSCRGPGVPTIRHVPCPAESKGKKPAHHLSRAKSSSPASPAPQAEAPSATGKQNATPGSPPALSGLFLSGRRKKRPARTRCLAVPGQKAFSQGQPCSVGAFQFEALHVNPAACRFAAKNAVSPLTFGRTALCHSAPDKWARMGGAGYRPAETSFLAGPVRYARHRKKTAHRASPRGMPHPPPERRKIFPLLHRSSLFTRTSAAPPCAPQYTGNVFPRLIWEPPPTKKLLPALRITWPFCLRSFFPTRRGQP